MSEKRKNGKALIAACVIAAVALILAGCGGASAGKTIKIALQAPITGDYAYEGQMAKQSVEVAAELINKAGGVPARQAGRDRGRRRRVEPQGFRPRRPEGRVAESGRGHRQLRLLGHGTRRRYLREEQARLGGLRLHGRQAHHGQGAQVLLPHLRPRRRPGPLLRQVRRGDHGRQAHRHHARQLHLREGRRRRGQEGPRALHRRGQDRDRLLRRDHPEGEGFLLRGDQAARNQARCLVLHRVLP